MPKETNIIPMETIENKILLIRGKKVMLDKELAILYGVDPRALRQQVKRNPKRFPKDFMFQLNKKETELLVSQNVTPKRSLGGHLPYVFTEQGIAMLSSVLTSNRAIEVNVQIIRTFTKLREVMLTHKDLQKKIEDIIRRQEGKFQDYDKKIRAIFDVINKFLLPEPSNKKKYGFLANKGSKNQ